MHIHRVLTPLLLTLVSLPTRPGYAQADPEPAQAGWLDESQDPRFRSEFFTYGMELAVHGQDEVYVSPLFRLGFSPIDNLSFELQLGFVGAPEVRVGNPMLTVWYADRLGPANPGRRSFEDVGGTPWARSSVRTRYGTRYRLGLSLTAPLADGQDAGGRQALAGAALQRGLKTAWLWSSQTFGAAIPLELSTRGEHFIGAVDAAFALLAPTDGGGGSVQFAWQVGLELAGAFVRDHFTFGARVDLVHRPGDAADVLQVSTEPFLQLAFFDHFLRAGLRMNLDEYGGPPFVPTVPGVPSWSVMISLGGVLYR